MHYREAGNAQAQDGGRGLYSQEIEITNRADALHIRHHFRGLTDKRIDIVWPTVSKDRTCHLENADSCDRLNEGTTAILEGANERQSISYVIPKTNAMKQRSLFKNIFATLREADVSSTVLHITDETGAAGMWISGLRKAGSKEMDLIDYSLYRGSGGVTDLYWQQNSIPLLYDGEKLVVYGKSGNVAKFKEADELFSSLGAEYSTIVLDNWKTAVESSRFLISDPKDVETTFTAYVTNRIASNYLIGTEDGIAKQVMASIISGQAVGSAKTQKIYAALTEALTDEEFSQLKHKAEQMKGEVIDAKTLDELVGSVMGFSTSFFKRNMQEGPTNYPFLLEDTRILKLNDEEQVDTKVILKDGKSLYSATKVLSRMGFSVRENEQSIYIYAPNRSYRFPKKEKFYVFNERKYELNTIPFEKIGEEYYFEENAFKRLFLVSIEKTNEEIQIIPISALLKDVEQ